MFFWIGPPNLFWNYKLYLSPIHANIGTPNTYPNYDPYTTEIFYNYTEFSIIIIIFTDRFFLETQVTHDMNRLFKRLHCMKYSRDNEIVCPVFLKCIDNYSLMIWSQFMYKLCIKKGGTDFFWKGETQLL